MRSDRYHGGYAKSIPKRRSIRYLDCLLFLLQHRHIAFIDIAIIISGSNLTG